MSNRSPLRYVVHIARILFGLLFLASGVFGIMHPEPPKTGVPEKVLAFFHAMVDTGYLFYLVKGTEVAVGALLLLNRFVPLALVVIAPVIVNIVAVHIFLAPQGLPLAIIILVIELFLVFSYRRFYSTLFSFKAVP